MDKSIGANKRRQDKRHKKPHPVQGSSVKSVAKIEPVATTPLVVIDDRYSKRLIEPNLNSYRNISPIDSGSDDEQLNAADLEKLLYMPPSAGGHFFLSTEKHWEAEAEEQTITSGKTGQYGHYFQVDTKKLNTSIRSIPLFERNEYPKDLFSKREIDSMKLSASLAAEKIVKSEITPKMSGNPTKPVKCLIGEGALPAPPAVVPEPAAPSPPVPCLVGPMALPPELRMNPNITGNIASTSPTRANVVVSSNSTEDVVPIGNNAELSANTSSDNIEKTESNSAPHSTTTQAKDGKEDIQQWLDNILEM